MISLSLPRCPGQLGQLVTVRVSEELQLFHGFLCHFTTYLWWFSLSQLLLYLYVLSGAHIMYYILILKSVFFISKLL